MMRKQGIMKGGTYGNSTRAEDRVCRQCVVDMLVSEMYIKRWV